MQFHLDDDQLALRDAVRSFCADRLGLGQVADRELKPADPGLWRGLAELGVLGLLDPGDDDDLGPVEAAIAFEELGRHLAPGPLVWSAVAAGLVAGVPEGDARVAGVAGIDVTPGLPVVIEHGAECDAVAVLHDDRVEMLPRSALRPLASGTPFDPLTPTSVVDALPPGDRVGDADTARRLRLHGTVLSAAVLVGVAQGALDVARHHALERVQFGVPIGSFQAIKHLLADMYVRLELARAETYAAAAIVAGRGAGDADRVASAAKLLAGDAGLANGRAAVQILGGMGFSWDMLPHYYLKRAWVLEHGFGSSSWHAESLGASVGVEVTSA